MPLALSRRKGSPYFYLRGTIAGRYVYESTGTRERGQAEALRIRRETEIWQARKLGARQPASFAEAAVAYIQHGGERRFLPALINYFRERPLSDIRQAEVDRAAHELFPGRKPATLVRQVYGPMVAILSHAADAGLEGARHRQIKMPKVERAPARWATDAEIEVILANVNPRILALVLVMTYTGRRIGDCLGRSPRDFTMRPGWMNVSRTKNGEPAFVPLPPIAQAAVAAIMPASGAVFGYRTVQGVNKALKAAAAKAGAPGFSTHEIGRHSFAARLLNAGFDLKTVKEAGGWKKLQIVDESYGHLEIGRVHDAMLSVAPRAKNGS
jgi:integrase